MREDVEVEQRKKDWEKTTKKEARQKEKTRPSSF